MRMPESMHERYDRDERRLIDTAAQEISNHDLLDAVIDVASPIMAASAWNGFRLVPRLEPLSVSLPQAR